MKSIGDKVWFIRDGKAVEEEIEAVYYIFSHGSVDPSRCFDTKQLLLESL